MSIFSRISREAKILIGITCLAAASLIWFNLITQQRQGFGSISLGGSSAPLPGSSAPTVQVPAPPAETVTPSVSPTEAAPVDVPTANPPGVATVVDATTTPEALPNPEANQNIQQQVESSTATIPDTPQASLEPLPLVGGEIQAVSTVEIAELPFLVTSPPSAAEELEGVASSAASADAPEAQRASINPFAPLVLVQQASPASSSAIVDVPIPSAPQPIIETSNVPTPVAAPASPPAPTLEASPSTRTVIPPLMTNNGLLRPLPSGSLPATPTILTQALNVPEVTPDPETAPVSENTQLLTSSPTLLAPRPAGIASAPPAVSPGSASSSSSVSSSPDIITSPLSENEVVSPSASTAVGASALSRYLRDNNVRFTGSVNGPVSVGVFRSNTSTMPIIVSLGQSFPDTDFVLSSLKGQQAEIRDQDDIQILALDLWR
ncbi:MAG: hypothetical protein KC422_13665 [Trueperaceae bacterium]|nr:hypothetical protein [Trueperaceae bacterium]